MNLALKWSSSIIFEIDEYEITIDTKAKINGSLSIKGPSNESDENETSNSFLMLGQLLMEIEINLRVFFDEQFTNTLILTYNM